MDNDLDDVRPQTPLAYVAEIVPQPHGRDNALILQVGNRTVPCTGDREQAVVGAVSGLLAWLSRRLPLNEEGQTRVRTRLIEILIQGLGGDGGIGGHWRAFLETKEGQAAASRYAGEHGGRLVSD